MLIKNELFKSEWANVLMSQKDEHFDVVFEMNWFVFGCFLQVVVEEVELVQVPPTSSSSTTSPTALKCTRYRSCSLRQTMSTCLRTRKQERREGEIRESG